jgi:UDP-N-acetylglucosamine--N-acetylmuramyl-(pentapeptide) pyrophosphoryl-undecaprenol N-acetylglucosamine transferase
MSPRDRTGAYVIAAGGTGGHIYPGIALAEEIRRRRLDAQIVFVGTAKGLENKLVPEAGFPLELVSATGFMGKSFSERIGALARLPAGFREARALLLRHRARVVAGVGGYVSVPVLAAARSLGIPTLIHESNARPGLANRLLNRFATRTAVGLEAANRAFARPGVVTGTPVRSRFFDVAPVDPEAVTHRVLVFGGSQGSRVLNRALARAAPVLEPLALEVVHQTGAQDLAAAKKRYYKIPPGWRLAAFLPRLWEEIGWADLVVSRAGAMTVAELAAAGRPAILVPFAAATEGHQLANALALSKAGAALTVREEELETNRLAAAVEELFSDRKRLAKMGENARKLAQPEAAKLLVDLLFEAEARG